MLSAQTIPKLNLITNNTFTAKEIAFIAAYLVSGNGTQAVQVAGYNTTSCIIIIK